MTNLKKKIPNRLRIMRNRSLTRRNRSLCKWRCDSIGVERVVEYRCPLPGLHPHQLSVNWKRMQCSYPLTSSATQTSAELCLFLLMMEVSGSCGLCHWPTWQDDSLPNNVHPGKSQNQNLKYS